MALNAGGYLGIIWLIFWLPLSIWGTTMFWRQRNVQPVKARNPFVVVTTDVVLIIFVVTICFQRIFAANYPCVLNLWSGWMGLLMVFTAYLWRGWLLYFTYNLALCRLEMKRLDTLPYFVRNRHYASGPFLTRFFGCVCVSLMFPCAILTAGEGGEDIINGYGDGKSCDTKWAHSAITAIVACFLCVFLWLAFNLKSVDDAFQIKQELKFTGAVGVVACVIWAIFNNESMEDINNKFPVSSLALMVASAFVFGASTLWPLYRSIKGFPSALASDYKIPENLDSLKDIIDHEDGQKSFKEFLIKEFSVENILFYLEVEEFEKKAAPKPGQELTQADIDQHVKDAHNLYQVYIVDDAVSQVNVSAEIVTNLEQVLKSSYNWNPVRVREEGHQVHLIFEIAKHEIFKLMDKDSYPRYKSSELYKNFLDKVHEMEHKKKIMAELPFL